MFRAPNVVLMGRASGIAAFGFLACQLLAIGFRDGDFKPSLGSAAFEHVGAIMFVVFMLGLTPVLRKWERADTADGETPAADGARLAGGLLALVLIVATTTRIAAELGRHEAWKDMAAALDIVCLVPLVGLMPFLTIA